MMQFVKDYSEIVANMKKVLLTEPQVYVDSGIITRIKQADLIARDLDLNWRFDDVDRRYYFTPKN